VKWLFTLLLSLTLSWASAQVLTQVYVDPCNGQVLTVTVPINNGAVTVVYRGKAKVVTANDVTSGALTAWINMINSTPCPQASTTTVIVTQAVAQATQQATQQATAQATQAATAAATSSATANAASAATRAAASAAAPPPPPPPSTPPPPAPAQQGSAPAPSGGGESGSAPKTETKTESKPEAKSESKEESKSESKSEEKSEEKSEKKSEEKKSSSKSNNKAAAKLNPIVYSSDLTILDGADSPFSAIMSLGASQSSLQGNISYGLTSMIWSTFDQFALSSRYTMMGKVIKNFGLTGVYLQGTTIAFATAAAIKPIGKGVTGFNYALTYTGEFGHGLMAFYTRPFRVNKYLSMSPDIYISNSLTKDVGVLTGSGFDVSLSKRFKFNCGLKVSLNTNPDVPMMFMGMIGTKINL
jgi:hypothetical protein